METFNCEYIYERIKSNENGCWIWQLYIDKDGYGRSSKRELGTGLVHRISYLLFKGEIPNGFDVDHVCFNPSCCNPDHLRLLPASLNRALQRSAIKTECIHGHKLTGDNLYVRTNGLRTCKKCHAQRAKRYREKRAAA